MFNSLKNICKETKFKESQFKLIRRIVVTKEDDECLCCGEKDSIKFGIIFRS